MVFDPLSIFGYVGTAAGLTGFLATTVAKLEKLGRDYGECGQLLEWHSSRFATLQWSLDGWKCLWCHDGVQAYSEEVYDYFWGPDGFSELQTKLRLIHFEIDAIGLLLYSAFEPRSYQADTVSTEHWRHWVERLDHLSTHQKQFVPNINWLKKICFAGFKGATLDVRLERLHRKVKDLTSFHVLRSGGHSIFHLWTCLLRKSI